MPDPHCSAPDLEWFRAGDHVCHLFHTLDDVSDVLIPFFKSGLERDEACLWVASPRFGVERASSEMRAAVAGFDRMADAGRIRIIGHDEWYASNGKSDNALILQHWLHLKDEAIAAGFSGLRINGSMSCGSEKAWSDFVAYEQAVDRSFRHEPIVALCSYCLDDCSGKDLLEVMGSHRLGLGKRRGIWQPIEVAHAGQLSAWFADWQPGDETDLVEILEGILDAYALAYAERITIDASRVALQAPEARRLRLALLGLVADATRLGALAIPAGRVTVRCHVVANGSRRLRVAWAEEGFPGSAIPYTVSAGTLLVAGAVESYDRSFEPGAMQCTFELPMA